MIMMYSQNSWGKETLTRVSFKGTVMQIEKALINGHFTCFKSILKVSHSNYL